VPARDQDFGMWMAVQFGLCRTPLPRLTVRRQFRSRVLSPGRLRIRKNMGTRVVSHGVV
jgi:hypothetical protein